ncbi:MAG: virulence RhuM family protein [Bacteroidia bacterium]|nr:virulence RhuM family protein [Bacteroidia bacterium]
MADLFAKDSDTIGLHVRNIYAEGELLESATTEESSVVQKEGQRRVTRKIRFYNLDVIISVGYRVKSRRGTEFRIWATNVLRQLNAFPTDPVPCRDIACNVPTWNGRHC